MQRHPGSVAHRPSKLEGLESAKFTTASYEAVLGECAAGDNDRLARIYACERRQLRALACRIVHHRDQAEDVVHDAFAQILRDAKSFNPARGSARAWVYAIVRNTALKSVQKAAREVAIDNDRLASLGDQFADNSQSYCIGEGPDLRACLEEMEPRRRASLLLAIVNGRTHAEIAQILGVPIGTVKAWIRRELVALRGKLK